MRDILERVEELLSLQEKLANLILHRARLSINTAFDVLYYNIELLDLMQELIASSEELKEDYTVSLILEALSWMGFILPAIEESCPIFLQGSRVKVRFILNSLEEVYRKGDYYMLLKELQSLSNILKYQIMLARRAYTNLV